MLGLFATLRSVALLACAAMLSACGGSGSNVLEARISVALEAPGGNCATGGSKITAGLDANGDGVLGASEVDSTQYVCNGPAGTPGVGGATGSMGGIGPAGFNALVAMIDEPAGANCANGGKKLSSGLDSNGNGMLDPAEITSSSYVCNGSSGTNGTNGANGVNGNAGANGLSSLVAIVAEPVGTHCAAGGNKISSGPDVNANGVLDPAEVATTSYLCNGAAGHSVPMIQSLASGGLPAAPGATVYITATGQSASGLALSYHWMVSVGWTVVGSADTNVLQLTAPVGYSSFGAATVYVTDSASSQAVGTVALTTVGDPGPTIEGVAVYPQPVITGANLLVSATHPFGAALTTRWEVGGISDLLSGTSAYWRSPGIAGLYLVKPTVSDGTDSVTSTVPMVVGSPSAWPKFHNNLQGTGVSPVSVAGNTGSLAWSISAGSIFWASPTIAADGTVYAGSNDFKLYATNPDGSAKWSFTTGGIIHSTAAVAADGTIYFTSWDLNAYAVNPDGSEKWRFAVTSSTQSSPTIGADGTIYQATSNKFYAITPDGQLKWSIPIGSQSTPAIGPDGSIYFVGFPDASSAFLYALNPDGTTRHATYLGATGAVNSSPALAPDGTVYVGFDTNVFAIDPNDGTFKGSLGLGAQVYSAPAIGNDGTVYVGALDGKVYALRPDCSVKWSVTTGATVYSSPTIAGDGTILIGSQDARLYAINPNGSIKWTYLGTGPIKYSSPAIAADGTIYVGTYDNKLLAIR